MRLRRSLTALALGGAFALMAPMIPTAFAQAVNPGAAVNSVTGAGNGPGSPGTNAPTVKINGPYSPAHPYEGNDLVNRSKTGKRPRPNMWSKGSRSNLNKHGRKTRPTIGNGRPDSYFTGTRPLTARPANQPGGHGVTGSSDMSIN